MSRAFLARILVVASTQRGSTKSSRTLSSQMGSTRLGYPFRQESFWYS